MYKAYSFTLFRHLGSFHMSRVSDNGGGGISFEISRTQESKRMINFRKSKLHLTFMFVWFDCDRVLFEVIWKGRLMLVKSEQTNSLKATVRKKFNRSYQMCYLLLFKRSWKEFLVEKWKIEVISVTLVSKHLPFQEVCYHGSHICFLGKHCRVVFCSLIDPRIQI